MDEVLLKIPREVLHATRMTPDELRRELAISLFQQGKLSFGKARQMAEMSFRAFQQMLGSREIALHYDVDELGADMQTIQELGEA